MTDHDEAVQASYTDGAKALVRLITAIRQGQPETILEPLRADSDAAMAQLDAALRRRQKARHQ